MKKFIRNIAIILGTGLFLSGIDYLSSYTKAIENKNSLYDSSSTVINNSFHKNKNIEVKLNESEED